MKRPLVLALALTLAACASYGLVPANQPAIAARNLSVTPPDAWNRLPRGVDQLSQEENWTKNGAVLDSISFFGGLQSGAALGAAAAQGGSAGARLPRRHVAAGADRDGRELLSGERRGGAVHADGRRSDELFSAPPAWRMDFDYLTPDDVRRKGRAVMAEVGGKLYLMTLDGTRSHYFDAARPDFDAMVASARVR